MKVRFKNNILSYTGKCDDLVYYYNSKFGRTVCRAYTPPKLGPQHSRFTRIAKNIKALDISPGYINDLRVYTDIWNSRSPTRDTPFANYRNVLMKLLYKMIEIYPQYDLATITRDDIEMNLLPCLSVFHACEANLLKKLQGYELLTAPM